MNKYSVSTVAIWLLVFLSGCATMPKIGQQKFVQASGVKPSWINETWMEQDDKIFVTGSVRGADDFALGIREAEVEGIANLIKAIQVKVRFEFGRSTKGQNLERGDLGKIVEEVIALTTENIKTTGLKLEKMYWEKQEETVSADRIRYVYDCYAFTSISKADYAAAIDRAINGELEKAKEARNRSAEKLLNEVKTKLNK